MQQASKPSISLTSLLVFSTCWLTAGSVAVLAQTSRHSDVTEVVVVEVPVQVINRGLPVRGLTADQFEVFDGRERQDLIGFDAYDLSTRSVEQTEQIRSIPTAARRHFLLFFDLSFSDPSSIVRARHAAQELVSTGLNPTDLVGVATYSASSGIDLILSFTSDRQQVQVAIDTLGLAQLVDTRRDPLGITLANMPEHWGTSASGSAGGRGGIESETALKQAVSRMESSVRRADDRNNILALVSSLNEVAELLRNVDGRKHLVYLSEGFDSSIIVGQGGGTTWEERQAIQRQNDAAAYGEYEYVDSNLRFGDTSTQNELGQMLQEFVRADCVIQAIDIGGLRAGADMRPRGENKQGLFMLADGTGGQFIENFNNLTVAMEKVLENTSVTYVLAFQADDITQDGSFHKLKVKLKDGPKGARLIHRPGYYAPKPYSELSQKERAFTAASQLYGASSGELRTATLAAAFETASGLAYVPTLIEIDGNDLLKGNGGEQVTAEVYAYAMGEDGQVHDYFNQIVGLDLEKTRATLEGAGFKFWNQFALLPGRYVARILVRNAVTGVTGVSVFPFQVPDAALREPALMAPLFPEPVGKWLIVRGKRATESTHEYPFTIQGDPFVPAVKPALEIGHSTPAIFTGYNLESSVQVSGELLTLDGEPVEGLTVTVGERRPSPDPTMAQWAATIGVEDLDGGDYVLKVTATDPETGEAYSSTITVTVTG